MVVTKQVGSRAATYYLIERVQKAVVDYEGTSSYGLAVIDQQLDARYYALWL